MANSEGRWLKRFKIKWDSKNGPPIEFKWPPMGKVPPKPKAGYEEMWQSARGLFAFNITWGEPADDTILNVVTKCITKCTRAIQFGEIISKRDTLWYIEKGLTTLDIKRAVHVKFIGDYSLWFFPYDATLITTRKEQHIYHMKRGTKITDPFPSGAALFLVEDGTDIETRTKAPLLKNLKTNRYFYEVPENFWGYILSSTPLTNTISRDDYYAKQRLKEQERIAREQQRGSKDRTRR